LIGKPRGLIVAVFTALLVATSAMAFAQALYRWTDAAGKTHYGDRPPKDAIGLTRIDTNAETNAMGAPLVPPKSAPAVEAAVKPPADRATQRRDTRERLRANLDRALEKRDEARKKLADGGDLQDDERQVVKQRSGLGPVTPNARQNCRQERGQDGKLALTCPVSIPNDQYYDRIARLEEAVRQAEAEVEAAETAYRRGVD
jgi:hypothetical protein